MNKTDATIIHELQCIIDGFGAGKFARIDDCGTLEIRLRDCSSADTQSKLSYVLGFAVSLNVKKMAIYNLPARFPQNSTFLDALLCVLSSGLTDIKIFHDFHTLCDVNFKFVGKLFECIGKAGYFDRVCCSAGLITPQVLSSLSLRTTALVGEFCVIFSSAIDIDRIFESMSIYSMPTCVNFSITLSFAEPGFWSILASHLRAHASSNKIALDFLFLDRLNAHSCGGIEDALDAIASTFRVRLLTFVCCIVTVVLPRSFLDCADWIAITAADSDFLPHYYDVPQFATAILGESWLQHSARLPIDRVKNIAERAERSTDRCFVRALVGEMVEAVALQILQQIKLQPMLNLSCLAAYVRSAKIAKVMKAIGRKLPLLDSVADFGFTLYCRSRIQVDPVDSGRPRRRTAAEEKSSVAPKEEQRRRVRTKVSLPKDADAAIADCFRKTHDDAETTSLCSNNSPPPMDIAPVDDSRIFASTAKTVLCCGEKCGKVIQASAYFYELVCTHAHTERYHKACKRAAVARSCTLCSDASFAGAWVTCSFVQECNGVRTVKHTERISGGGGSELSMTSKQAEPDVIAEADVVAEAEAQQKCVADDLEVTVVEEAAETPPAAETSPVQASSLVAFPVEPIGHIEIVPEVSKQAQLSAIADEFVVLKKKPSEPKKQQAKIVKLAKQPVRSPAERVCQALLDANFFSPIEDCQRALEQSFGSISLATALLCDEHRRAQ